MLVGLIGDTISALRHSNESLDYPAWEINLLSALHVLDPFPLANIKNQNALQSPHDSNATFILQLLCHSVHKDSRTLTFCFGQDAY